LSFVKILVTSRSMKEGENMSELIESLTTNETQVDNKRLTPADEKILWAMVNPPPPNFGIGGGTLPLMLQDFA
jgi:hypothetical protein